MNKLTHEERMNLFFDTETTGVPDRDLNWREDYMKWPYVLSWAWRFKGKSHYYLIHQEGRKVPREATAVNGITTEMVNNDSIALKFEDVLGLFFKDAMEAANIIGHNVYFDTAIVQANVYREFGENSPEAHKIVAALFKDKRICTMRGSKILFGNRWPKLTSLHELLFNGKSFAAHDALEDVLAVERCYYELKKRRVL